MYYENFETTANRSQSERTQHLEHLVHLYITSSYIFEDSEDMRASFAEEKERNVYSRYSNSNYSEFIKKIVSMEKAELEFVFSTGIAVVFSSLAALLNAADHIVAFRSVFGFTHGLFNIYFPKWNISQSYFKGDEVDKIEELIKPETKILFAESSVKAVVDILDLKELGAIGKKKIKIRREYYSRANWRLARNV